MTVTAPSEAALKPASDQVVQALGGVSGLTEVTSDLAVGSPRVQVEVDDAAAAAHGLSASTIGQVANQAIAGRTVTQLPVDGQRTDVVLRAGTAPATVDQVKGLPIPGPAGVVRLDEVAKVSTVDGPASVHRTGGDLSTTVTAKNTGDNLSKTTADIKSKLDGLTFAGGASYSLGGVSQDQQEAFSNLFLALLAAIAIVFLIMVATFRSLIQPLILLVSIPFAATGAIGLLLATGTALGLPALIGMLMLVGIVVTNAIVLIDLINQYRAGGHERRRRGDRGRPAPAAADPDDRGGDDLRAAPDGAGHHRPGRLHRPAAGDRGDRRPGQLHAADAGAGPDALHDGRDPQGAPPRPPRSASHPGEGPGVGVPEPGSDRLKRGITRA